MNERLGTLMQCESVLEEFDMPGPLLSICIPTFNRAELLRSALWSLVPQVRQADNLVEVIVSDNCSPDDTQEVVRWAQQYMPIRYHRNSKNIGAAPNFFVLTNELAEGQFAWLLGDDDLVREHAIRSVLDAVQMHPELDYVFVNHSYEDISERRKRAALVTGADFPEQRHLLCFETNDLLVPSWEEIIHFGQFPGLFTSMVSHVFRLSKWRELSLGLEANKRDFLHSLENTFPQACIVARMMVGKPAFYLGYPHVIMFYGSQDWFAHWPMILFVRVLELADLFETLGADTHIVDHYRNMVFKNSSEQFWQLLTNPALPGRESFSLRQMVLRYWNYNSFWKMVAKSVRTRICNP